MYEYHELDQRLKFFVEAKPKTFLFIRVSTTSMYEYVVAKLYEFADLASVKLSEEKNILEELKNITAWSILLVVDPVKNSLLKRLDYLRDSLHDLDKFLIFVFFMEQYDRAICDYPDFCAYASPLFDYSTKLPVPFTLIFSNNLISNDKKNIFGNLMLGIRENVDTPSFVLYGIDKLKRTRMNDVELQTLNKAVLKLLENIDNENMKDIKNTKNIYIVLEYLEILSGKELFEMVQENLIYLYNHLFGLSIGNFTINKIYVLCIQFFAAMDFNDIFFRNLIFKTIKIMIPYYSYSNNEGDINKALQLSVVRKNYITKYKHGAGIPFSDDQLAESYNDMLILKYMTEGHTKECLTDIEFLKHLKLNYENALLYYYNKITLLLLSEKYYDAVKVCDEFIESFCQFKYTGMAYYRIQLIKNWIKGMYGRHLQESIDYNIEILKSHRTVFPENHYSIAEIHFCNAQMYYELKDMERSEYCITKAKNILKQNHSARLRRLKSLVNEFALKLNEL